MATATAEARLEFSALRLAGIAALLTAKGMDLATTASVLLAQPGAEANPTAAAVVGSAGLPGLVVLSVAVCAAVVVATEWGAARVEPPYPVLVRLGGSLPPTLLWSVVAVHNVRAIAGALA